MKVLKLTIDTINSYCYFGNKCIFFYYLLSFLTLVILLKAHLSRQKRKLQIMLLRTNYNKSSKP